LRRACRKGISDIGGKRCVLDIPPCRGAGEFSDFGRLSIVMIMTEEFLFFDKKHVVIQSADEVDDQLKEWIGEAYNFSMMK
jgi:hypothetical protein